MFILCSFKINVFLQVSHEPQNLLPQNRCFVRGFRQFSLHLTKCHACHGICTLSPLDAALTLRFKNTQHDTSEVLRLPRKMTIEVSKVLRLPRKCNSSSENDAKILRPPHKTTFDTLSNRLKCYKVPPLSRETKPREVSARMVANGADGCAASSEHTLNPQTPRVKREPLLRIREKGHPCWSGSNMELSKNPHWHMSIWLKIHYIIVSDNDKPWFLKVFTHIWDRLDVIWIDIQGDGAMKIHHPHHFQLLKATQPAGRPSFSAASLSSLGSARLERPGWQHSPGYMAMTLEIPATNNAFSWLVNIYVATYSYLWLMTHDKRLVLKVPIQGLCGKCQWVSTWAPKQSHVSHKSTSLRPAGCEELHKILPLWGWAVLGMLAPCWELVPPDTPTVCYQKPPFLTGKSM